MIGAYLKSLFDINLILGVISIRKMMIHLDLFVSLGITLRRWTRRKNIYGREVWITCIFIKMFLFLYFRGWGRGQGVPRDRDLLIAQDKSWHGHGLRNKYSYGLKWGFLWFDDIFKMIEYSFFFTVWSFGKSPSVSKGT